MKKLASGPLSHGARPQLPYEPTMPVVVRRASALFSDNDFVVLPDSRLCFAELEEASRRLAKRLLAAGVGKGSRVGIHLPTGPRWAIVFAAVTRIGAIAMPFSTLYRPDELRQALRVGDVCMLISVGSFMGKDHQHFLETAIPGLAGSTADRLCVPEVPYLRSLWLIGSNDRSWATCVDLSPGASEPVSGGFDDAMLEAAEAEVRPADPMVAVFTSGTTAEPKGVVHTQGAVIRKTSPAANGSLNAQYGGRVLSLMPFFWVGGLQEVMSALQSGATVVTLERLNATAAIELGNREAVTSVMGNAAAMRSVLGTTDLQDAIPTLQPLPQRPWAGGPSSKGDASVAIGMTETLGPWNSVYGMQCRVVNPDTGQICADGECGEFQVRGYALMAGLCKREREDTFTADGFYATGDLGYQENERFYFTARRKDLIKAKGANVAPAEVEAVLNAADSVRMSFVVGLPHPSSGEQVVAGVVRQDGAAVDTDKLLALCRAQLSSYKVPSIIEVLDHDEIPYLSSSKPDRLAIKSLLEKRCSESL